jgi:kynureninase
MAPLRASLALFDEAGLPALRAKSERLTGYLEYLLNRLPRGLVEIITPGDPQRRGCALSLKVADRPREVFDELVRQGIVGDFRPPNVIRLAPVPLYNTFQEVWTMVRAMGRAFYPAVPDSK